MMKLLKKIEQADYHATVEMQCEKCNSVQRIKFKGCTPDLYNVDLLESSAECDFCLKQIDLHRKKYPISIDEITAFSSFVQILGDKPDTYTPEERKERWFRNGELLKEESISSYEMFFTDEESNETCLGCKHRIIGESWCKWSELPCNYNPVTQQLGMACMGLGYNNQPELQFE